MKDLLIILENASKSIAFPPTIKYICICRASFCIAERERQKPLYLQSKSSLIIYLWLMPEFAAGFKYREACEIACKELKAQLGEGYNIGTCATKSDIIMADDNYITVN